MSDGHYQDPKAFRSSQASATKGRDGCRVPLPWDSPDCRFTGNGQFDIEGSFGFSPSVKADGSQPDAPHLPQPRWFRDFAVDVESDDPSSMLSLYRNAIALRRRLISSDTSLEWLSCDELEGSGFEAEQIDGVIAFSRVRHWVCMTNFNETPVPLVKGRLLLSSFPLTEDDLLPADATVWIQTQ